ncbi:MAG TPA: CsbD family protein [Casimicrobiaceae bacterium]|nr:CsbD family protein [Casimicrobiaceae bacterium]
MNKDQMKGAAKDMAGKVQRKAGQMTGSTSQQAKGAAKQVEGKLQKGAGNLQQAAEDADRKSQQMAEDIDRKPRP